MTDFAQFRTLFESTGRSVVGTSDCGNVWIADGLAREFPESRFVVVRNDLEKVRKSLEEIGLPDNGTLEKSAIMLEYVVSNHSHISIEVDDLSDPKAVKMICEYVGAPFDIARFNLLTALNVQVNLGHLVSRMTVENVYAMHKLMEAN